jgi:hypothetical protein
MRDEQTQNLNQPQERADRRWLILAALLIAVGAPLLLSESYFRFVFGGRTDRGEAFKVAEVVLRQKDVRAQSDGEWAWNSLQKGDSVFVGDGVYSGEKSRAQLHLRVGGTIELGENSLIVFSPKDQLEAPQFSSGEFKLLLSQNEKTKFRFNGEVVEVQGGSESEIEITVEADGGSRMTVIKGQVDIQRNGLSRSLSLGTSMPLDSTPEDSFQSWKKVPRGKTPSGAPWSGPRSASQGDGHGGGWLRDPQSLEPEPPQLKSLEEMRAPPPPDAMPKPTEDIRHTDTLKRKK